MTDTVNLSCFMYISLRIFYLSDGAPLNLFYSTSAQINELYSESLRIPLFQSAELDDNRDGRTDRLEFGIQMPLAPTETIHGFTALVYVNTQLDSKARYVFDGVSYATFESASAINQLSLDGDLMFRQTWPLTVKGGYEYEYAMFTVSYCYLISYNALVLFRVQDFLLYTQQDAC